ncbi:MAG: 3-isopropylmalate dehydratase small subunit, partial [Spirochaetales bacterium]|nr:3-isopropylmalate dehydratase small subunit [Spirochaetales bacterium]
DDIDTDRIIPARYLKCVTFEELGQYAFFDERFNEDGGEKPHPFNNNRYKDGKVLVVNKNFGCGSSREHAPQSLMRMGIAAIIGESFAEIFAGNCTALGIPAIMLKPQEIEYLMHGIEQNPSIIIEINLEEKAVMADGKAFTFSMPESYRQNLTSGTWDTTATLLANVDMIKKTARNLPYMTNFQNI